MISETTIRKAIMELLFGTMAVHSPAEIAAQDWFEKCHVSPEMIERQLKILEQYEFVSGEAGRAVGYGDQYQITKDGVAQFTVGGGAKRHAIIWGRDAI